MKKWMTSKDKLHPVIGISKAGNLVFKEAKFLTNRRKVTVHDGDTIVLRPDLRAFRIGPEGSVRGVSLFQEEIPHPLKWPKKAQAWLKRNGISTKISLRESWAERRNLTLNQAIVVHAHRLIPRKDRKLFDRAAAQGAFRSESPKARVTQFRLWQIQEALSFLSPFVKVVDLLYPLLTLEHVQRMREVISPEVVALLQKEPDREEILIRSINDLIGDVTREEKCGFLGWPTDPESVLRRLIHPVQDFEFELLLKQGKKDLLIQARINSMPGPTFFFPAFN